jgi:hypothetical protein
LLCQSCRNFLKVYQLHEAKILSINCYTTQLTFRRFFCKLGPTQQPLYILDCSVFMLWPSYNAQKEYTTSYAGNHIERWEAPAHMGLLELVPVTAQPSSVSYIHSELLGFWTFPIVRCYDVSETVQNRTYIYMNFFDHKDLGNHLPQLCPKVVKHSVYYCHSCLEIARIAESV